ncbi:Archaeophage PsiM2, terminase large subunit [uncultured Caudovirales phage]|uniref:Archaeophage PsiM2, terminase large subunit n=1 Tax=uncultured Caudovirales phage TaxID=2100421 RepID=A0A6J5NJ13_9CAUD|nr:Archaeophage PsiM2, terminase large subunit [uncultured Caudovirales phage]
MKAIPADIDQREAAQYLLKLRRAAVSFPGFMDFMYPEMTWPSFMRELQEVLDLLEKDALVSKGGNPVRNVLVTMPPRHAKSFNGTINFPAYCLARRPSREVMISAYNDGLAGTFGRATRDIVTDKRLAKAFPKFELSRETRAVDFWKTLAGGAYYAVGLAGTTTGRGANLLEIDDPYKSREEAESVTIRRKVWEFYTASLLSRMQPDKEGQPAAQIVTHTRWHPDDLAGRIMETPEFKRGEWVHLNFQALTPKERGISVTRRSLPPSDPRSVPEVIELASGEEVNVSQMMLDGADKTVQEDAATEVALWPERFDVAWLRQQKERIGEREFAALYQQSPYIVGGNIVKDGWFRRYDPSDIPEFAALAFGVDTAFKAKQHNDYSVFTLGGVTEIGDIYILRVWRGKWEFPELKRQCVQLNAAYRGKGVRGFWIEDAASGQSLIQELKRETGVPALPWRPGLVDKVAKVKLITPTIEAGRVFIPTESDWVEEWLAEWVSFPSVKHDDQVDSGVILIDTLSRMVVTGNPNWAAPIGSFLQEDFSANVSVFTGRPLEADPHGWQGNFGKSVKALPPLGSM